MIQYVAGALPHISSSVLSDCASAEVQEQESHGRGTGVMSSRGGIQYREDVHPLFPSLIPVLRFLMWCHTLLHFCWVITFLCPSFILFCLTTSVSHLFLQFGWWGLLQNIPRHYMLLPPNICQQTAIVYFVFTLYLTDFLHQGVTSSSDVILCRPVTRVSSASPWHTCILSVHSCSAILIHSLSS